MADWNMDDETAATAEPPSDAGKAELHNLVEQLPPDHTETARKFLQWLIHEGGPGTQAFPASDAEVDAASDAFIIRYRDALERLAK